MKIPLKKFPFYKQLDQMDCGPTCLRMIAKHYGRSYSVQYLREQSHITREGVSMLGISEAAEEIGMHTLAVSVNYDVLRDEVPLPCIAHWRQRHFVVVYHVTKTHVYVSDPAFGRMKYTKQKFLNGWLSDRNKREDQEGLLLLMETTPAFYEKKGHKRRKTKQGLKFLLPYFRPFKSYIVQLLLGLLTGSLLQLVFPFLTQAVVDYGINYQNINFVYLILVAQLMLFFSQATVGIIRSWLLLHMGSRINISIIADFLIKMMKLPIHFFDTKTTGDLMQRIEDNHRVERFLSSVSLNVIFSFFNLIVFGAVLAYYNVKFFVIFLIGSAIYIIWVLFFMKKRAELDYKRFDEQADNSSNIIQLLTGMPEIKLNNSERRRRWEWEEIQVKLFKISVKGLALDQYQGSGANFINELKNILITFFAAKSVIDGEITLGMMLSIQYIIGQLNAPINEFIGFIRNGQDARLSLERLGEIHDMEEEETPDKEFVTILPENKDIHITQNMSFRYSGSGSPLVLQDLDMHIPEGKVTAVVGVSGSGKTTLIKLLLKFYDPTEGKIMIGGMDLANISPRRWRERCGAVMQDGYIFGDTIAKNITESDREGRIDKKKLLKAVQIANIEEYIESLPLGYNTKIGMSGINLSGGQKQRILIARAVYKDPEYIFFDEATSSLDANNERIIMQNLEEFYKGRTVLIIAHRLSTVKNADQIVVLDGGKIVESGNHAELTAAKGAYYQLVKNQLELGK